MRPTGLISEFAVLVLNMSVTKGTEVATADEQSAVLAHASGETAVPGQHKGGVQKSVVFAYLLCALIWGTTWYGVRVCVGPGGFPAYPAAALRFTIASAVLAVIWFASRRKLRVSTDSEKRWISLSGLLSGLGYGLLYVAEEQISGGLAAVLSATTPLIAVAIAMTTKTEHPTKRAVIGSLIALMGVILVFHDRLNVSPAQASAVGLMVGVCILNACSNVTMKKHAHDVAAVTSNMVFTGVAAVVLWTMALCTGTYSFSNVQPAAVVALLYLTFFGTLLAFASFFYLLKKVRLSTAMTLAFITPTIALVVDAFLEKRAVLNFESYVGIAIVLSGVALSVLFRGNE